MMGRERVIVPQDELNELIEDQMTQEQIQKLLDSDIFKNMLGFGKNLEIVQKLYERDENLIVETTKFWNNFEVAPKIVEKEIIEDEYEALNNPLWQSNYGLLEIMKKTPEFKDYNLDVSPLIENGQKYKEQIREAMSKSLEIVQFNDFKEEDELEYMRQIIGLQNQFINEAGLATFPNDFFWYCAQEFPVL